jgi:hypothetical protein
MSSENQLSEQAALESIDVQKHDKQMNELLVRQLKRVADACEERTKTGPVQGSISAPASLSSYGPSGRRAASESASSGFGRNGGRDRKSESANPPAPRNPKGRDISAANDYESDPDARAFAGAAVARRSRWPNSSNVRDDSNKAAPRHTKRRRNSSSSSSSSTSSSDSDSGHKQRGRGKGRGGTERLGQAPDRTGGQAMPASSQSNSNQVGPLNYPGFCAGAAFAGPPTGALGGPTVALSHHEVGMPRGPMSISPTCAQAPLPDGYRAVPESVRDYVYFVKLIVACLNMYHDFQLRKLQEEYHVSYCSVPLSRLSLVPY